MSAMTVYIYVFGNQPFDPHGPFPGRDPTFSVFGSLYIVGLGSGDFCNAALISFELNSLTEACSSRDSGVVAPSF